MVAMAGLPHINGAELAPEEDLSQYFPAGYAVESANAGIPSRFAQGAGFHSAESFWRSPL